MKNTHSVKTTMLKVSKHSEQTSVKWFMDAAQHMFIDMHIYVVCVGIFLYLYRHMAILHIDLDR